MRHEQLHDLLGKLFCHTISRKILPGQSQNTLNQLMKVGKLIFTSSVCKWVQSNRFTRGSKVMTVMQCGVEQLEPPTAVASIIDTDDAVVRNNSAGSNTFFVLVSKMDPVAIPLVFFPYPVFLALERACPPGYEVREVHADVKLTFTVIRRYMYNAMGNALRAANIRKTSGDPSNTKNWNIFWGHHLNAQALLELLPFQKVNHFPGSFELGRKDRLCGSLLRMKKKHPNAYARIIPETYLTEKEYDKQQFLAQYHADPNTLWILKPPNLSCGRGIKIVNASLYPTIKPTKKKAYVAQRYVATPFLINGLKFDLRIYVLVTSFDPLRVYLFDDGLVRFCTEPYSTSKAAVKNRFGHLTNYSVNKKNTAAFKPNQDGENEDDDGESASKWSLKMLLKYLRAQGKSRELEVFQQELEDMIIKTLIAVESKIGTGKANAFELYGFDVLLEGDEMIPWLLEVNVFPSLSSSSPMDKRIKTVLVSDMFQLVGIPFQDPRSGIQRHERDKQDRLHGVKLTQRRHTISSGVTATSVQPKNAIAKKKRTTDELMSASFAANKRLGMDLEDDDDLRVVKTMEEEMARRGHFSRIFPTAQSFERYAILFDTPRYRNVLCMRWLQFVGADASRRRSHSSNEGFKGLPLA